MIVGRANFVNTEHLVRLRFAYMEEEAKRDPTLAITAPEQVVRIAHHTAGWLLNEDILVFMAYEDAEPVGYMVLEAGDFVGFHAKTGVKVSGFFVLEAHRHGVAGAKLLRAGYDFVRKNWYPRTQAVVQAGNALMRGQLERNGYRVAAIVYERDEVLHGQPNIGTEAEQKVHDPSSGDADSG